MKYQQRIKDLREDKDLLQKEVAEILGIDQRTYSRYENGINDMPIKHIIKLCLFYNTSADYILGLTNKYRTLK